MCGGSPLGWQAVSRSSCSVQGQTWHAHRRLEGGFGSVAFPWGVCAFLVSALWVGVELGWPKPPPPPTFSIVPWLWSCGRKVGVSVGMWQRPRVALQHCHQPSYDRAHARFLPPRTHSRNTLSEHPLRARSGAGPALAEPPPSRGRKDAEH